MKFKLAIIGFGVVGQGLLKILLEKKDYLKNKHGFEFSIVAVSDSIKGSLYYDEGLDAQHLLETVQRTGAIKDYQSPCVKGLDSLETIEKTNANTIVEASWTDVQTGEPALSHIRLALTKGKNVVMTNKGPVTLAAQELTSLAKANKVHFKFEGTVLAGTPALNLCLNNLAASGIKKIEGILNGTTNYILTEMENGLAYETALSKAKELGYAEADPTGDIEGWDALGKVVILSNVVLDQPLTKDDVVRQGIAGIKSTDIESARSEGKRYKLIARMTVLDDGSVEASVKPEKIPYSHPLASVSGPTNALTFHTDLTEEITIIGPGAGQSTTGFALLADLLEINRLAVDGDF